MNILYNSCKFNRCFWFFSTVPQFVQFALLYGPIRRCKFCLWDDLHEFNLSASVYRANIMEMTGNINISSVIKYQEEYDFRPIDFRLFISHKLKHIGNMFYSIQHKFLTLWVAWTWNYLYANIVHSIFEIVVNKCTICNERVCIWPQTKPRSASIFDGSSIWLDIRSLLNSV